MARICPQCGSQAIDDQSQFCNKCGTSFPEEKTMKIFVRTMPRTPGVSPAPVQQPPPQEAPEPRTTQAIPARPPADSIRIRVPAKPAPAQPKPAMVLPFRKFIARDFIRLVYWIGVIAILLVVVSGILADTAKKSTAAGTSAEIPGASSGDILAGLPLFWIGMLLISNFFWRVLCETSAIQFALYSSLVHAENPPGPVQDSLYEDGMPGDAGGDEFIDCPRCGKVVHPRDIRACSHCGVQGCSSCIRMTGLVRKMLTCRDCYQGK